MKVIDHNSAIVYVFGALVVVLYANQRLVLHVHTNRWRCAA